MTTPVEKAMAGTGTWVDDRLGAANFLKRNLRKAFPDHWSFLLGEIALYSFVIVLLTGVFLTFWFKPSMIEVAYSGSYEPLRGVRMSEAYESTLHLSFDVRGGLLMRQIHHWSALLFAAAIMVHMLRVFFTGAYRKPREINWLVGVVMFTLSIIEGLLGYTLPDDLLSGTGMRITQGVLQSVPVVGTYLYMFLFGGELPGHDFIPRIYTIHVLLLPALFLALITAHMIMMWVQKHTQFPGKGRTEQNVIGVPFYPHFMAKTGAFFMFTFAVCALLGTFAQINPIWLFGPYIPADISAGSQPDFYMGFLEGALRIMVPWEINIFDHTLSLNVLLPALVPMGIIMTGAAVYPFLEQWITGDRREHHLLDRPRNAPVRTGIGFAAITFYGVLWAAGGNDIIAETLQISLNATTYIFQFLVIVGPIVAFIVARRICIGLQRRDAATLDHGYESGVITRSPDGEFSEIHAEPVEEIAAAVQDRDAYPALPPAVDANGVPAPGMKGVIGKVRGRLNEVYTERIPFEDGHGNGHGDGELEPLKEREVKH